MTLAADIARTVLGSRQLSGAAKGILAALDRAMPSAGKALGLAVGTGELMELVAASGVWAPLTGRQWPVADLLPVGPPAGQPASATIRVPGLPGTSLAEPFIVVPLRASARLIGILGVTEGGATLEDAELDALAELAPVLTLALDAVLLNTQERHGHERERLLAAALAMMEHPVFIVSTAGRILYANEAAVRAYGYEREELGAGMLLERLRAIAPGPAEQGDLYHALAERGGWSGESVHRRKDGSTFPTHVAWNLIRDDDGFEVGLVVTARDLSEDRRVEEHLRQAEKLAALGELVAGVAHEVNNPLTGISAFSQLLMEDELSEEQHESVRLIKREADRAVGVIRDLLVFARKAPAREAVLDVNEVVQRTLRLRTYHLTAAGVEVVTELAEGLPGIQGDDQKVQQVMLNLLVNAEHAMLPVARRTLRIRTWREPERIVLEVADSGTGMTPEVRAHIFEPFYTTKPEGAGTGLGLSVSYGIVQAHGGTIDVESSPGVGTAFRISFPVGARQEPTTDRIA